MPARLTVKQTVSQASIELGIAQREITTAVQSSDQDIAQMVALLSAVADEVLMEEPYRRLLGDGMWLVGDSGYLDKPSDDNDQILFDGRLAVNGLKFRFLKAKGLEFGEEMRDFTSRLNKLAARYGRTVIDLYEDEGRSV